MVRFKAPAIGIFLALAAGLALAETELWSTLWPVDVMGQSDFYSSRWRVGPASEFFSPLDISCEGGRLAMADTANRRVLVWNAAPANGSVPPDFALGQPDFGTFGRNYGGLSASSMVAPSGVCLAGGRLLVVDALNSRVMIWNTMPSAFNQPCDLVLGQPNPTTAGRNTGGVSASSMNTPMAVWSDGQAVAVADTLNHRVLVWTSFPAATGQAADLVLGQADFLSAGINRGGAAGAATLYGPLDLNVSWGSFFVTDTYNHRVLIWDSFPRLSGQAADRVLGQPDFASTSPNAGGAVGLAGLNMPLRVDVLGGRVLVSESANHRVLVWDSPLPGSSAPADRVIGQAETTTNVADCSPRNLRNPHGLARDEQRLYLMDTGNHRVLCFPPQSLGEDLPDPRLKHGKKGRGPCHDPFLAGVFPGQGKGIPEFVRERWESRKAGK